MLFTSTTFYVFLVAVLAIYFSVPWRLGRWCLVLASYLFYGQAMPWYCLLLLASTLTDFFVARFIYQQTNQRFRKLGLSLSITINIGLLVVFKYSDFIIENLNFATPFLGINPLPELNLLLPVGISFYTFQTLSYTLDVYRRKIQPTENFAAFALYVSFFPQLVAGPIERASNLLPQFIHKPKVSREDLIQGFHRILWGLTKKLVFADRIGLMVDAVYANPDSYSAPEKLLAMVGFSFQLYLDFSAYCDIAIGIARTMGIKLSENFRWPFIARNPVEFWSRWHITLTSWFRDYLYRSILSIHSRSRLWATVAMLISMVVVGLWHGAAWNFIYFGLWSGLLLVGYQWLRRWRSGPLLGNSKYASILAMIFVMLYISAGLVLFRAPDLDTAVKMMVGLVKDEWSWSVSFYIPLVFVTVAALFHYIRGIWFPRQRDIQIPAVALAMGWMGMLTLIIYGSVDRSQAFIYFQF